MHQIEISDFTIDVVRKPLNIDDAAVKLFAISKLAWIKKNQRKFGQQERQSPRVFAQRESHYFEGRRYLLRVTEHQAPAKIIIKTKTYIDLFVRPNTSIEQRNNILNEWYRKQLKSQIPAMIAKWEKIIGVSISDWGVKQMKTKWGTCNIEQKRIWLNLELAKKPLHCLEYIVVHEIIHLLERHHNAHFLLLMEKYLPKWKYFKEELNRLPVSHGEWTY